MKRFRALVKITAILIFLSLQLPTMAQVSPSFFGMSDYIHRPRLSDWEPWPSVPFANLRSLDTYTEWWKLEPSRGVYDWSNLDWLVGLAEQHNVDLLYTFAMTPRWASSDPNNLGCHLASKGALGSCAAPVNIAMWDEFVTAVATRYAGRIHYYELWNEPNIPEFWTGTPAQLVTMAQHAYQIIKSIDPGANVLTPSPLSGYGAKWMGDYLAAGGGQYSDIIAFHGYQPQRGARVAESIATYVDMYRRQMALYGQDKKPLWDTEASWGYDILLPDAEEQSAYLAKYYILQASKGVARFYWFAWDSADWGTLWERTMGIHKPGLAYGQVYNWLVDATIIQPCSPDPMGTWTCGLSRPGGYQGLIAWNSTSPISFLPPAQYQRYRGIYGEIVNLSATTPVMLGNTPLLFESTGSSIATAVLNITPQSGTAPLSINADASASLDNGGMITSTLIDFGDGAVSRSSTAPHTYSSPGRYIVVATVADNHGVSSTASASVIVSAGLKPLAVLSVTPQNGVAPLAVLVDSTQSSGAPIISRSISFGDGTSVSGAITASHVFRLPGVYELILTITSNAGLISTTGQTIVVQPPRPPRDYSDRDPRGEREPNFRLKW